MEHFNCEASLPTAIFDQITELRIHRPEVVEEEARLRRKRDRLTPNGRLVLVAADHPARGVTKIRGDEFAMGNRWQFLARIRRVFDDKRLDGVVASSDVLDELLALSHLERQRTAASFLDDRVLVGSMNRGGLAETAFEMEDTFTCMTAERLSELGCDGGKMLWRLDAQDAASGRTLTACAHAVNSLRAKRLAAFVEPFEVQKKNAGYETLKGADSLVRLAGIAAALGDSSLHVWLKIPYCNQLARVCSATTLPILLLGGPARESSEAALRDFADGLAAGSRVRGAIVGRNLLFPGDGDPLPMCRALTRMVHERTTLEEALNLVQRAAGQATVS